MWIAGALIIFLVARAAHHPAHSTVPPSDASPAAEQENSTALRILKERCAKGELTGEEFKTKKINLL